MRTLEEEWDTVMFFLTPENDRDREAELAEEKERDRGMDHRKRITMHESKTGTQKLAIFGDRRGRSVAAARLPRQEGLTLVCAHQPRH
jgi:hypothetical protein